MSNNIAMIPARMGSQRLKEKNIRELGGIPLITRAIRKCLEAKTFDEVWVNSEHPFFGEIAKTEGAQFHLRPEVLGNNMATSEQFVDEFLRVHECNRVFQVHSIAPLLSVPEIRHFVHAMEEGDFDALLSYEPIQIECALEGIPINFSFLEKTNSQELKPVQRICWSITGWKRETFLNAIQEARCASYSGKVGFHPVSRLAAHVIKTESDLSFAEALLSIAVK